MSWIKWKVTVTRLIEEECTFFVNAPDAESATDLALESVADVADGIWIRTNCEPHTFTVESVHNAEEKEL